MAKIVSHEMKNSPNRLTALVHEIKIEEHSRSSFCFFYYHRSIRSRFRFSYEKRDTHMEPITENERRPISVGSVWRHKGWHLNPLFFALKKTKQNKTCIALYSSQRIIDPVVSSWCNILPLDAYYAVGWMRWEISYSIAFGVNITRGHTNR